MVMVPSLNQDHKLPGMKFDRNYQSSKMLMGSQDHVS